MLRLAFPPTRSVCGMEIIVRWNKFRLTTTTEAVDIVSGLLVELGIDGIEVEDNIQITEEEKKEMYIDILPELPEDDGHAYVIFYMDENEDKDKILSELNDRLNAVKEFVNAGPCTIEESVTEDKDWVNNWKKYFKPFNVDDILIKPTWEDAPEDKEEYKMILDIDPGTSFGTGKHETTQLCIRQLRKYIKNGDRVLDVGCGSGILSIIGKKLGAGGVTGIDIDKIAVEASIENSKVNNVEDIRFFDGNIIENKEIQDKTGYECYDIVVANILADIIIPLTAVISAQMKKGALYITSGIINTKEQDVVAAINANPELELKEITRQGDWVSITAKKI